MHKKNLFDFKYIGIALIFLVDFNINNIDILPDFIAVLLILKAAGKIYFVNESFAEVRTYLKVFGVVSVVKFAAGVLYLIFLRDSYVKIENLMLTATFTLALFELVLSILIFKRIFKGLEQFSFMSGSFEKIKSANTVMNILNIFFAVKFVLTFVVQIPVLLSESDLEFLSLSFNNTFFTTDILINLLIPPCFIIQTLAGIFALSITVPFFNGVSKDKKLYEHIDSTITGRLTEDFFFRLRLNLKSAFAFFIAGCIFFVDMRLENIIFLPDFMICVLFFLGVAQISGNDSSMINKKLNLYLLINCFISAISYVLNSIYSVRIYSAFADQLSKLYHLKTFADLFYHASVILFVLIFIEFYYFIKKLQYKHMEFSSGYLKKYFTAGEKVLYKDRNKIFIFGGFVFSVKTLEAILPQDGLVMFLHSLVLIAFTVWAIKSLISAREDIYNYYN